MKKTETFAIGSVLAAIIASAALYGVWLDKVLLYAPLLMLIYIALAMWVALRSLGGPSGSGVRHGAWGRALARCVPVSNFKFQVSSVQTPPGGVWLLLFFLTSAVMIPFSVLPYEATVSTLRFGCYTGVYFAAANILSRFSQRKTVWMTLLTALVFIALYSLVQHKAAPNQLFGMERYAEGYWKAGRLGGTYQCPNHIAHLFQMWIPLCFVFLFIPQIGWFGRILCLYALPLSLTLIYQTQSRAGILGTVAALSVTALALILRKSRKAFWIALLIVPLLGAGAVGGLYAGSARFRERMQPVVKFVNHIVSGAAVEAEFEDFRPQTWMDSMSMFADRPVTGFGPGNYGLIFPEYRQRVTVNRMLTVHPHNEYVELLTEYGLIGTLLALAAVLSATVQLIRFVCRSPNRHHVLPAAALLGALAGTAVHGFFDFELRIFPNALMFALLAGCAVAPLLAQQKSEIRNQKSAVRSLTSVLRPLISVLCLLSALWAVQVMSSSWIRALGDRAQARQEPVKAQSLYQTAVRIDPRNWAAHMGLAQVIYTWRYGELDPARKRELAQLERAAYQEAYRRNVKKEEIVYGLGRVELFLGNRDKGLDYLRQAANYKRFNDFYWRKLGIELRKAGLYEEALGAFEHAQKLNRSNRTTQRNIQWLREIVEREK